MVGLVADDRGVDDAHVDKRVLLLRVPVGPVDARSDEKAEQSQDDREDNHDLHEREAGISVGGTCCVLAHFGLSGDLALVGSKVAYASDRTALRRAALEAQVEAGLLDARSFFLIPPQMAREAKLTFQDEPVGKPQAW